MALPRFRYALCNELYEGRPFAETCRAIRDAGYTGIEIAPFTLSGDSGAARDAIRDAGLEFVGLHWLLAGPAGLHVTTPDRAVREKSWDYMKQLVDLCASLGPNGLMVLGSPKQRSTVDGSTPADATARLAEGLAALAPFAQSRGVTLLLEALSPDQTDVVTTLDQAAAIVARIGSPALATMFDSHNAAQERVPHAALIRRHFHRIKHVHLNELDGRHPGAGDYDFRSLLAALAASGYRGWLSLEVFDSSPGADRIAADSLRYLEGLE